MAHPKNRDRERRNRRLAGRKAQKVGAQRSKASATRAATRPRAVRRLLEGIGTPEAGPFIPDPFQLEALERIEREDLLVTAPTGAGKTWIAREEVRRLLGQGRRAWYTSPLKALTNSKYEEFRQEFGAEQVGILTGDRRENADAPLIVGTTEVYRNQLFDALRGGSEVRADLVVFDEAHYMADEERGHVWEEAIILTPPRVRVLLLSATIGNPEEVAAWIERVRGTRCGIVKREGARPVPLRAAFLFPDGEIAPLVDEAGKFNAEILRALEDFVVKDGWTRSGRQARIHLPEMPPATLLNALGAYDLLPAIVFLPTRRRCDEAATEAAMLRRDLDEERRAARRAFLREFARAHPEIRHHRHWETVVRGGVAAHHAGHLPAWKLVVERMMGAGLLDAIFATATVAAGVDFPARTVVLTCTDMRTGHGWRPLTASEFQQMTGRAGRRGKDNVGFIVASPGPHQNPQRMVQLLNAPPDPLESQFRATYTTLLNLLDAYGSFAQVREIVERSFAYRDLTEQLSAFEHESRRIAERIKERIAAAGCDSGVEQARALERLASARAYLLEGGPATQTETLMHWLDDVVVPGRVVQIGRNRDRLIFVTERRGMNLIGVRPDGRRVVLSLARVGRVYSRIYGLRDKARELAFAEVRAGSVEPLAEPRLHEAREETSEAVALLDELIERVTGPADGPCARALWETIEEAERLERLERRLENLRAEAWRPFEQRARVLAHFGYLDMRAERVTERGRWLADLRLDRPLLVGEALERGLFARLDVPRTAGLMAALAADEERDYGELPLDDELVMALADFEQIAYEVASIEWREDLEPASEINFSAAAAAARWAQGVSWLDLVRETKAEEGDLFRLFSRTGESLMQIAALRHAHADAARRAKAAAEAILREPVRSEALL
jgi:ATP-dependent RNA helicase HelY